MSLELNTPPDVPNDFPTELTTYSAEAPGKAAAAAVMRTADSFMVILDCDLLWTMNSLMMKTCFMLSCCA